MNPIPKHPKKEMTLHTRSFSKLGYRTDPAASPAISQVPPTSVEQRLFPHRRWSSLFTQREGPIDLPLEALVWQDAAVKTWISYNQPEWIAQRHGVANAEDTVTKMADLLNAISRTAVDPKP